MKSIRNLAFSSVLSIGILTGCATTGGVDTSFIGTVQALAAQACLIIPTVESIIAIFNSGIAQTAQLVTNVICNIAPPPSSLAFKALPKRTTNAVPAVIGTTVNGIIVTGWRASEVRFGHKRGHR